MVAYAAKTNFAFIEVVILSAVWGTLGWRAVIHNRGVCQMGLPLVIKLKQLSCLTRKCIFIKRGTFASIKQAYPATITSDQ